MQANQGCAFIRDHSCTCQSTCVSRAKLGTTGIRAWLAVKDSSLDSKAARRKLPARSKPHWRSVERGLHLGYRRHAEMAGPWIVREYVGSQQYREEAIGVADDLSDADGHTILTYWQAIDKARARIKDRAPAVPTFYIEADVIEDHLKYLEDEKKRVMEARYRALAHIIPKLGKIEVKNLTTKQIEDWRNAIAQQPARVRTKSGDTQKHREHDRGDDEVVRARRATTNRCRGQLKAALNRAWRNGKVADRKAWQRVQPFKGVGAARERYLTIAEATRLLNGCDPDFRLRSALRAGVREKELLAVDLVARD